MRVSVAKMGSDGLLTQSEVSPSSVEEQNTERTMRHRKAERYMSMVRTFSIAFHIPYRVRPSSTMVSPSAEGEGEAADGCPTRDFPPARYRSTSARSTRPSFPLPGASNTISTPFSRAKWRTEGRESTSFVVAFVIGTDSDEVLERDVGALDSDAGEVFGSSGCGRRAAERLSDGGCVTDSEAARSGPCSWRGGGMSLVFATGGSDVGISDELDSSSSTSMMHRPSPTLATCPS